MGANRNISIAAWLGACASLGVLLWSGAASSVAAAERPPARAGGRPIFGEGGLIRRLRDELAAEAAAAGKTPPATGVDPRKELTPDPNAAQASNAKQGAKPTFREPKPTAKSLAKQPTPPALNPAAKTPVSSAPILTTPAPVATVTSSTNNTPASSTIAKSTAPSVIPFKDVLTQTYDKAVVSVLVSDKKKLPAEWKSLFNGKDLTNWDSSKFGGDGEITVENGMIVLAEGGDMTGITYQGEVPRVNYALEVEAQRLDGVDFFAGITFPVGETYMTLVPGGWGGGVFGLSSIDSMDASENETTQARTFKDKQWYKFLIQVTEDQVQVSVDGKVEIELATKDKKLSTRGEVESSKPLGICTWRTKGAIRSIRIRPLTNAETQAAQ
jgi:hypothetical protein